MTAQPHATVTKAPYIAGLLAWIVPGAGHWYLGLRARALVIFFAIGLLFWSGVAIGAVRDTVDPHDNLHWFLGEICTGGHALAALAANRTITWTGTDGASWGKSRDIAMVYAGVAGMLNLLAIFDAIVRSVSGNLRELEPEPTPDHDPDDAGA